MKKKVLPKRKKGDLEKKKIGEEGNKRSRALFGKI